MTIKLKTGECITYDNDTAVASLNSERILVHDRNSKILFWAPASNVLYWTLGEAAWPVDPDCRRLQNSLTL